MHGELLEDSSSDEECEELDPDECEELDAECEELDPDEEESMAFLLEYALKTMKKKKGKGKGKPQKGKPMMTGQPFPGKGKAPDQWNRPPFPGAVPIVIMPKAAGKNKHKGKSHATTDSGQQQQQQQTNTEDYGQWQPWYDPNTGNTMWMDNSQPYYAPDYSGYDASDWANYTYWWTGQASESQQESKTEKNEGDRTVFAEC